MKLIECPRDAWQGYHPFIPTNKKAAYLNQLLRVGFDTIDFGSFVSPKAMPHVSDTRVLIEKLDVSLSSTKLLAIIANERGAQDACEFEKISCLGYPFSISETFQLRNTNASIEESLQRVIKIADICQNHQKELVLYISMGFGNPYGDPWNVEIVGEWTEKLSKMGVKILSLSDTIGSSTPEVISYLFSNLIPKYPEIEFGAHLHTTPDKWFEKIDAAYNAGCRRYDGAIQGFGGCPMAKDDLTGNMPTEKLLSYFTAKKENTSTSPMSFESSYNEATKLFGEFH